MDLMLAQMIGMKTELAMEVEAEAEAVKEPENVEAEMKCTEAEMRDLVYSNYLDLEAAEARSIPACSSTQMQNLNQPEETEAHVGAVEAEVFQPTVGAK